MLSRSLLTKNMENLLIRLSGHMLKGPILSLLVLAGIMSPVFSQQYTISTFAGGAPPPTPAVAMDLASEK
jgi:hypothetical protein